MSVLGIISEYNPFHNGHKFHIEKSKKITNSEFVVSIMSGSFVQRGEPAFLDKWSRAKSALDNGVDLVIELPHVYSSQRAETFAEGAIKLMDSLNVVDYISFGAETTNIDDLYKIANVLVLKPEKYILLLNSFLEDNISFPKAREKAILNYFNDSEITNILNSSNNILGIEYLKWIITINSKIKPYIINRSGAHYNSLDKNSKFMSATGIRHSITNDGIQSIENFIPISTKETLYEFISKYDKFNILNLYTDLLIFKLRFENLQNIVDSTDDLIIRVKNNSYKYDNIEDIINFSVSKTYTKSRIKRLLIHILFNLTNDKFTEMNINGPGYIRVLASNEKGLNLLKEIKINSNLHIINKFSKYHNLKNENINKMIEYDKISTDLYFLNLKYKKYNMDYLTSPYISIQK